MSKEKAYLRRDRFIFYLNKIAPTDKYIHQRTGERTKARERVYYTPNYTKIAFCIIVGIRRARLRTVGRRRAAVRAVASKTRSFAERLHSFLVDTSIVPRLRRLVNT